MSEAVLLRMGMSQDAAHTALMHKAATTLQTFFRRSQWLVDCETEYYHSNEWPSTGIFNPLLANTLFLELSEINKANMHGNMNKVKDFLTSDKMCI